jgi:hypothetical protein
MYAETVSYTCPRCNYETLRKYLIEKHLNRKRPCPDICNLTITSEIKDIVLKNRLYHRENALATATDIALKKNMDLTKILRNVHKSTKGYVYIVWVREFIDQNKTIYKVGKTSQYQPCKRVISQYTKGSEVLFLLQTLDCGKLEKIILTNFQQKYKQRKEYGVEYFEGTLSSMIRDIVQLSTEYV